MRLLVLDHFFQQDIDALRAAGGDDFEIRTLDYNDLRREAMRVFPDSFASGLEAPNEPRYDNLRSRWSRVLRDIIRSEYRRWSFDALIVPSDIFFYVRDAPLICHRLGIPFIVIQKETTISNHTMRVHSKEVERWAPPIADWMTCCSERHKEFWLRCGMNADLIEVTGQPRFDYYRQPERWPARADDMPTVLFFSYEFSAYYPTAPGESVGLETWRDLHLETESQLWKLASKGWRVMIKPHPQQDFANERRRMEETIRPLPRGSVQFIPHDTDTREAITSADVVVGFQTTALIEALTIGRPVIYTGWDTEAGRVAGDLIPFPDWEGPVIVVKDRENLAAAIELANGEHLSERDTRAAEKVIQNYLGPVDGRAAERALLSVARFTAEFEAGVTAHTKAERSALGAEARWKHASLPRAMRRLLGGAARLADGNTHSFRALRKPFRR